MVQTDNTHLRLRLVVAVAVTALVTSACSIPRRNVALPKPSLEYQQSHDVIVISVEIHYPGVPLPTVTPTDRYCTFLPSLAIWGDGYAFVDESVQNTRNAILSGQLNSETMSELFRLLADEQFFTDWKAPPPNPTGTQLKISAQLKGQPAKEYLSGDLEVGVYKRLLAAAKPKLKPLNQQTTSDPRVDAILDQDKDCNIYMQGN